MSTASFTDRVWSHYLASRRQLPWRNIEHLALRDRGYRVLVSEFMLQQTQVQRVTSKYAEWLTAWPTIDDYVRSATLADALAQWNGLGYNRRAKFLHQSLLAIYEKHGGLVPTTVQELAVLPGIGKNTAGAILAYTHNIPVVFIETNIRTVYVHEFFGSNDDVVTDTQLLELVQATVDQQNPREWYYALMDYGAYLKKHHGTQLYKVAAYKKQTPFKGSKREVRGKVLAILTRQVTASKQELRQHIHDDRLEGVLQDLQNEGLIAGHGQTFSLPKS